VLFLIALLIGIAIVGVAIGFFFGWRYGIGLCERNHPWEGLGEQGIEEVNEEPN
jgi:hypothetical protein